MSTNFRQLSSDGSTAQQQILGLVQDSPRRPRSCRRPAVPVEFLGLVVSFADQAVGHTGGELHAWACLQTPFWSVDLAVHHDATPTLTGDVLAWADAQAQSVLSTEYGRPMWFAFAFSDQHQIIAALEAAGYESRGRGSRRLVHGAHAACSGSARTAD